MINDLIRVWLIKSMNRKYTGGSFNNINLDKI